MKKGAAFHLVTLCALLFLLALHTACNGEHKDSEKAAPDSTTLGKSSANTASPYKIPDKYADFFADYRKKWTGLTGFEYSGLHWGQFISLYVNKNPETYVKNYLEYVRLYVDQDGETSDSEAKHFEPYPEGTIFLKENYLSESGKPGKPMTVTVMIKKETGYDPATHDWQFIQFDVNGNILFDGNSHDTPTQVMCIKCHGNMAERDFIFSTYCSIAPKK